MSGTPRIAIVGGGFAGTMVAANLLVAERSTPLDVVIVERENRIGPGLAFGTWRIDHLLNVAAAQMSAWPDDPGHFVRWAEALGGIGPGEFASRRTYGRYIESVLADAERVASPGTRLVRIRGEVVDVETGVDSEQVAGLGQRLLLANGSVIEADETVLALGTPAPATPHGIDPIELGERYLADPWADDALDALPVNGRVLLVGTGLTMVDVALALRDRPDLELHAISRHGLLPGLHGPAGPPPALDLPAHPTARSLIRSVREAIAAADDDWRSVVSALRPETRAIWSRLAPEERRRLLRRVGRLWHVHRHCMPPASARELSELELSGRLVVERARVACAVERNGRLDVTLEQPGRNAPLSLRADAIVNCTGPCGDPTRSTDPLLQVLLQRGAVRPDALGLGLELDDDLRLIDGSGRPSQLTALGWLCRGTYLESTSVPELRDDARRIALRTASLSAVRSG